MRLTFREVVLGVRRSPLLSTLSVVTIAFSMFAVGLFGLVALNVSQALRGLEEHVEIRAFIAEGTPIEAITTALGDIHAFPEVGKVDYVTPEMSLARARKELSEFADVFDASVLPGSIEIRLKPGARDPVTVAAIASRVLDYPFVDDVRYGEEWVKKLYEIRNLAGAAGIVLGIAFAAVAIIIIGTTIRMSVLARAREISIMRLVGATDGFIRRPFLLDGFLKGVAGGALALSMTWFASTLVNDRLINTVFFDRDVALLGILGGGLIGLLGSAMSVGRHLREV
jgi:cell division transport system permease protein